jgi:hypothetical protein
MLLPKKITQSGIESGSQSYLRPIFAAVLQPEQMTCMQVMSTLSSARRLSTTDGDSASDSARILCNSELVSIDRDPPRTIVIEPSILVFLAIVYSLIAFLS